MPPKARSLGSSRSRHKLVVDSETSKRLARIRQHGTSAELRVRQVLHSLGYRFRISNRDLPGSPDVANRAKRWVVFVHGCFWHRHSGCDRATTPTRNRAFWVHKFEENVARDSRVAKRLRRERFHVIFVWECQIENDAARVKRTLHRKLTRAGISPRKVE
ncbi:MAG TPA: DNA mismatch endonuclease Vsr [Thermoanaerobaculia bacterium]|nr:DNA mismatch endonuclease Vsr [Thermoanaerobaculia bacterium]